MARDEDQNETRTARLDRLDLAILGHLQSDARITNTELARRVDLSPPGLQKRLSKLREAGVIRGEVALIDREQLGLDLLCFVQVTLSHHQPRTVQGFREAIREMPEVLECHLATGEFDYLLKVVATNHRTLEHFLVERLTPTVGVDKIRTTIVLNEIKHTTQLPLPEAE
ncbi:MAG: Lrp/AsnC family transcriptional regulator [Acidobacteria bacterium]|nr:MAG: Lrp/AsnC family transcriptional regulator [Acidobacteriota bacterium]REK00293.1 MAG: Lrp/AsnC family transcriptional regulator [Acidobacteriota bacterium]